MEVDLNQLPVILRDRFFSTAHREEEKDFKLRHRIRSTGGIELKGVTQIGYCEFKWVFRCSLMEKDAASLFLKEDFIEPLCVLVHTLQKGYKDDVDSISKSELDAGNLKFNKLSQDIISKYYSKKQDDSLEFQVESDSEDKQELIEPSEMINNDEVSEKGSEKQELSETTEEIERRIKLEEKIKRQKRKREFEDKRPRKKQKINLI